MAVDSITFNLYFRTVILGGQLFLNHKSSNKLLPYSETRSQSDITEAPAYNFILQKLFLFIDGVILGAHNIYFKLSFTKNWI